MSRRLAHAPRLAGGVAIAALATIAIGAGNAAAHVGIDHDQIVAGESAVLSFSVGHGCEGSPTNSMKFQVPEGVLNAQPLMKPGWDISVEREQLDTPVESAHGAAQTDRVATITFAATDGFAVPNDYRDTFAISLRAPETEGRLFFKVVQGCESGENPWIATWDGTGEEPDQPAPFVDVVTAAGEDGATPAAVGAVEVGADAPARDASSDSSDGDDGNGLAIAGLVAGVLGLAAGGTALVRSRRPSAP